MDAFEAQYGSDPNLLAVKDKLTASVGSAADNKEAQFSIILVIAIIGLIIQIMTYCKTKNTSDEKLRKYIKNARRLSLVKTWRLRRDIRREAVKSGAFSLPRSNDAFVATMAVGETLTDAEIDALLQQASAQQ